MTEQRSNVILPYDYDDVLDTILDIGCRLLESGAEVRRVEDTMERLCLAYGAHDVDVFSIVVLAGVTVEGPNEKAAADKIAELLATEFDFPPQK